MPDRLTHRLHILRMNGASYRLKRHRENPAQAPDQPGVTPAEAGPHSYSLGNADCLVHGLILNGRSVVCIYDYLDVV